MNLSYLDIYDWTAALLWFVVGFVAGYTLITINNHVRVKAAWLPLVCMVIGSACLATAAMADADIDGKWRTAGTLFVLVATSWCSLRLIKTEKAER